jgi:uncharacterized membrane protein (DUF2068 family)
MSRQIKAIFLHFQIQNCFAYKKRVDMAIIGINLATIIIPFKKIILIDLV